MKAKQAIIKDKEGKNDITLDVNYDKKNKENIKISIGNKYAIIEMQKLWEFVFTIVTPELAEKIIPVKREEREVFKKQHTVIVQKDLKVGDELVVNCLTDVRKEVADAMRRDLLEKGEVV